MSFMNAEHLSKIYGSGDTAVTALHDVSFSVERGGFLAIMGSSGAGKSTLLSLLGALATPTGGRLTVDGIDIFSLGEETRADFRHEYLGFVFQSFELIPYLTALENVMLPLTVAAIPGADKRAMAHHALQRVGLEGKGDRLPHQLSGGEQERVALARAVVNDPPIILADEPTGNLDSDNGRRVMHLLAQLNREGQTIVMVTHNPDYGACAGRTLHLSDGTLLRAAA